ncbi:MAG: DUF763 domain-containing protein [Candidatus Moranbacteria bacterium CG_4_10_14_3_um_filter_44_15]|nr:MAG: DUF763 domain-containing protein [Candidatus Moranbacteria bacterium CG_4_8_14_3_um_filter_43_15]PIX90916.1 MAG: DUF763 domain-containing protein [Candidatus Moranbacteria bacterium CG_4_10_14_3_um_filter_44_15]
MFKRGIATFTLDYGKCPKWLFERMVKLGREMARVIVAEYGPDEFVKRIADPVWFQALGTVLAFDWNASGLTTILTAALKEAIRGEERDLGIYICGGKGKTSLKTPEQISLFGARAELSQAKINSLEYNSRMAAKVDSSLIQDGFQIYHHSFFFSRNGVWAVVQQGMNEKNVTARRYHWFSDEIKNLVIEPHSGIISDAKNNSLNMTARESIENQKISTELVQGSYNTLMKDLKLLRKYSTPQSDVISAGNKNHELTKMNLTNLDFKTHPVLLEDFSKSRYLQKILYEVSEIKPKSYEKLLSLKGVGPKTIRALALTAEVIYGAKPSYEDPARYSFAHGGKDFIPYPVDRPTYDQTIRILRELASKMKVSYSEKNKIIRRLS